MLFWPGSLYVGTYIHSSIKSTQMRSNTVGTYAHSLVPDATTHTIGSGIPALTAGGRGVVTDTKRG